LQESAIWRPKVAVTFQQQRPTSEERTAWICEQARTIGFDLCGVVPVAEMLAERDAFTRWFERGFAGEMKYLHDPRRLDPAAVLEGARSVIVLGLNYNAPQPYSTQILPYDAAPRGWISRYAWGDDYHTVLGNMLNVLTCKMRAEIPEAFTARSYVDTGPISERTAALGAGLGWVAKNTLLIHPELGSWFFLAVILTTLELAPTVGPEGPVADGCGNCTLCIDACPTQAITEPYVLDARRCISYLTIELRGPIPEELRPGVGQMLFGCDICQDVCPWNRKAPIAATQNFRPREFSPEFPSPSSIPSPAAPATEEFSGHTGHSLFSPALDWIASLSEPEFREIFRGSSIKRTKWRGLIRNACVALGNSNLRPAAERYPRVVDVLSRLAAGSDALIAEHARWALGRLARAEFGPIDTPSSLG
jgi:epoxyqueuosine reductase